MPTLNWIGKEAVVRHHKEVPFRLLEPIADQVLPKFAGPKEIYAAANRMGARTAREGISFKQTPYALEV